MHKQWLDGQSWTELIVGAETSRGYPNGRVEGEATSHLPSFWLAVGQGCGAYAMMSWQGRRLTCRVRLYAATIERGTAGADHRPAGRLRTHKIVFLEFRGW